jgi:hypothetical protein
MSAVMEELRIKRSYYYETRAAAIDQGLLEAETDVKRFGYVEPP